MQRNHRLVSTIGILAAVTGLRGTVATRADRTKPEQITKATDGVKSVRNQLTIRPGS